MLCTGDVKITPIDYKSIQTSLASVKQHDQMVYILIGNKNDVTNDIHNNIGRHVWILPGSVQSYILPCP